MKKNHEIFLKQKKYFQTKDKLCLKSRISKIKSIRKWINLHEKEIISSILEDYRKPLTEIHATEIKPVLSHINFTLKNLKKWSLPKSVWTPLHLFGTKSKIFFEPKGVCLIISPWNYPFNLSLNPLISAISAGNCVVLKPSEYTPFTSKLIQRMVKDLFEEKEVTVIEGDSNLGSFLINLPFDHIFFTGSPEIGKKVMRSASNNLTSLTLELGGKNHAIIDSTANFKDASEKILWSKYVNCGQTCIAVNHVFVPSNKYDFFVDCLKNSLHSFLINKSDYSEIVSNVHANRLDDLLEESRKYGADLFLASNHKRQNNNFPLSILVNVSLDNPIINKEIFGPILPVISYDSLDDVIDFINKQEKSLALYYFSKSNSNVSKFINCTSSGSVVVNDCMLQYSNPNLPFGGVNGSGIGKSGGKYGFLAFSNEKSVMFQFSGYSIAKLIYPPYNSFKEKITKLLG